jgi:hypothetical protein
MFHGVHQEFKWLETPAHEIRDVLQVCPAMVTRKNIAVTSFDPEKLRPVEDKWLRECLVKGSALYLPSVDDPEILPNNVFDEWYIFSSALPDKNFKSFLGYEWFTLGPAQVVYFRHNIAWDLKRMRRLFWQEMEHTYPESYLSRGNRLLFVTRNSRHFSAVLRGLSSLARTRARSG